MAESSPAELDKKIRALLRRALAQSPLNRANLCDELAKTVGHKVPPAMLDAWCADTKTRWHLPAYLIPKICELTRDDGIQRELLSFNMLVHLRVGEFIFEHTSLLQHFEREVQRAVFTKFYGKKEGLRWFWAARQMFGPARRQKHSSQEALKRS
jgi:hypothetical protein